MSRMGGSIIQTYVTRRRRPGSRDGMVSLAFIGMLFVMLAITSAGAIGLAKTGARSRAESVTRDHIARIQRAMRLYYDRRGTYPCPADPGAEDNTRDFGRQVIGCTVVCPLLGTDIQCVRGRGILIGTVPVRSLKLSDRYLYDGWGRRITYAVDISAINRGHPLPRLDVRNTGGVRLVPFHAHRLVSAVILSHGRDGRGAWAGDGSSRAECSESEHDLDAENCNDDPIYTWSRRSSGHTSRYDDVLIYFTERRS